MSHWIQQAEQHQNLLEEATELMIEAAGLRAGDSILDIAAGMGEQSIAAAQKVGPTGTVLAIDISAEMLKGAANLAALKGYNNITTQVMNAEQLELPDQAFDAVISRLGLMLMAHQQHALQEIRRVLKPDCTLAALVWSIPERNPFLSLLPTIVAKYAPGSSHAATFFSLAGPGVFEEALTEAGFRQASVQAIPGFPQQFRCTVEEFFEAPNNSLALHALKQLSQQDQERVQEEARQALHQFEGAEGLIFPAELLLGVGTR